MRLHNTLFLIVFVAARSTYAATPNLLTAAQFGVLASSGVTNADSRTTVLGSIGSAPATPAVTGFTAVMVTGGTLYTTSNAVTSHAQTDVTAAYNTAAAAPCPVPNNLSGQDLGGMSLTAGASNVYCFSSSAALTGTLTLIGGPSDVFIFKIGSSLTTATNSKISLLGGISPCNVFWQVGSSATIQVNNDFVGNILAHTSITLNGGTLLGRALANTGAVTISGDETLISGCSVTPTIVLTPATSSSVCGSGAITTETATLLSNGLPLVGMSVTFKIISGPGFGTYGPVLTNASGTASFSVPSLALLAPADSIIAQFTDLTPTTWTSNTTTVSCVAPAVHDITPPIVTLLDTVSGPPKQIILSVRDTGSGLSSIIVTTSTNASVFIPPFVQGTTNVLGVTATKIDQSKAAIVALTVVDSQGNVTLYDPVFVTITIPKATLHSREVEFQQSFRGIDRSEGTVLVQNGTPGVDRLVLSVNGREFETRLSDGQTQMLDISSALFRGTNTVRVSAFGDTGSSVDLTISDSK
jgi:hypothetical protein